MINKITPVSFKGNTEKIAENNDVQTVSTTPIAQTELQVDTFTNTNKKSGNGSLFTGIMGILEMVNTLLSMTSSKK